MVRKKSAKKEDQIEIEKRNKNLKFLYNEGKRIINNMVDKNKKWLTVTSGLLITFSLISILLYFHFKDSDIRNIYLFLSTFYLVFGLILFYLRQINSWLYLESHENLVFASKLHIKEWYEFFNKVDYQKLNEEKYGLAEIILRIYYNIDQWLRIEHQINQKKYLLVFIVFFLVFSVTIPLGNSYSPFKEIGLIFGGVGILSNFIYLYMVSRKKMEQLVSKWHARIRALDKELMKLWRDY
ncbi:hypothetical protein [[Eubacterium] cellulosolvens]